MAEQEEPPRQPAGDEPAAEQPVAGVDPGTRLEDPAKQVQPAVAGTDTSAGAQPSAKAEQPAFAGTDTSAGAQPSANEEQPAAAGAGDSAEPEGSAENEQPSAGHLGVRESAHVSKAALDERPGATAGGEPEPARTEHADGQQLTPGAGSVDSGKEMVGVTGADTSPSSPQPAQPAAGEEPFAVHDTAEQAGVPVPQPVSDAAVASEEPRSAAATTDEPQLGAASGAAAGTGQAEATAQVGHQPEATRGEPGAAGSGTLQDSTGGGVGLMGADVADREDGQLGHAAAATAPAVADVSVTSQVKAYSILRTRPHAM